MSPRIMIVTATTKTDINHCFSIRRKVFVEEQHIPEELDFDGTDESASHLLALKGGKPVGTVRLLPDGHIGRLAVLKPFRNQGIGKQLIERMVSFAQGKGMQEVFLEAQVHAIPFYEKLGFQAVGEEFMGAGIPHKRMSLSFNGITLPLMLAFEAPVECSRVVRTNGRCLKNQRQTRRIACKCP